MTAPADIFSRSSVLSFPRSSLYKAATTSIQALIAALLLALLPALSAAAQGISAPKTVPANAPFSIAITGSGKATLYIIGPGDVLRRDIERGQPASFPAGSLPNAGHYLAILTGGLGPENAAPENASFDVLPGTQPAALNLLAKPSRLPVGLHNGISGAVYLFDAYGNLVTAPTRVSFELSTEGSPVQARTIPARDGAAWTQMDSSGRQGAARFVARAGAVSSTRVIEQVPGDPCSLRVSARQVGQHLELTTDPVKDCSGNPVPDGTIVTFTETRGHSQSTVDVPLKRGIAQVQMPAYSGARISVASGVVLGNEIRQ